MAEKSLKGTLEPWQNAIIYSDAGRNRPREAKRLAEVKEMAELSSTDKALDTVEAALIQIINIMKVLNKLNANLLEFKQKVLKEPLT